MPWLYMYSNICKPLHKKKCVMWQLKGGAGGGSGSHLHPPQIPPCCNVGLLCWEGSHNCHPASCFSFECWALDICRIITALMSTPVSPRVWPTILGADAGPGDPEEPLPVRVENPRLDGQAFCLRRRQLPLFLCNVYCDAGEVMSWYGSKDI